MEAATCYKVGDPDCAGFKEYSFTVQVNDKPYLYQIRARSLDEAVSELGGNIAQDFRQVREFGGATGSVLLVSAIVGGVALGIMAIRKIVAYLTGPNKPPPPAKPLEANNAGTPAPPWQEREGERIEATPAFPWTAITEAGVNGWRAGPVGEQHWRIAVYTDGTADAIRSEMAAAPEVDPLTQTNSEGVVVYRFPLTALAGQPLKGSGVINVVIGPLTEKPDWVDIATQDEGGALRSLIQYLDELG